MCRNCGCQLTPAGPIVSAEQQVATAVMRSLLADNDTQAHQNRRGFDAQRVLTLNLMSSPGAGKTALLEATADALRGEFKMAVIEGDLATENDARRLRAKGIPAVQITTGSACHLDARMVHEVLAQLSLAGLDLLFIENVGNLVCPASFDLGQHYNVTLLSAPEGDDKPAKYPVMFRATDLLLLSKADLIPVLDDFDPARAIQALRNLANPAPVLSVSAKSGAGMAPWYAWLRDTLQHYRAVLERGEEVLPQSHRAQHITAHASHGR